MLNSLKLCWDSRAFISRQRRDVSAILFVTCSQREREREREGEREGDIYRSLSYSSCNQSLPFACIGQLGIICAKMSFLERKALQTDTIWHLSTEASRLLDEPATRANLIALETAAPDSFTRNLDGSCCVEVHHPTIKSFWGCGFVPSTAISTTLSLVLCLNFSYPIRQYVMPVILGIWNVLDCYMLHHAVMQCHVFQNIATDQHQIN